VRYPGTRSGSLSGTRVPDGYPGSVGYQNTRGEGGGTRRQVAGVLNWQNFRIFWAPRRQSSTLFFVQTPNYTIIRYNATYVTVRYNVVRR